MTTKAERRAAAQVMGRKGGPRRAAMLSPARRREIARMGGLALAAKARARTGRTP